MAPPLDGYISQSFCDFEEARRALGWQLQKTMLEVCDSDLYAYGQLIGQ
jgi:hypothetical protein